MVRPGMTVKQLIEELRTWPEDAVLCAGSNDPRAPRPQPIVTVNTTYKWLLTEPVIIERERQ